MKLLTVLILLQIAATGFLYVKLSDIDNDLTLAAPIAEQSSIGNVLADSQSRRNADVAYIGPDEDRLRQIIREELGAQLAGRVGAQAYANEYVAPDSIDYAEMESRREQVAQQLDYYSSIGAISDADMAQLQMDIAKLDQAGRREMLGKLTQAINSGRLDGRL